MQRFFQSMAILIAFVMAPIVSAQSMHSLEALQQGADYSVNYPNAVALQFDVGGFSNPSTASAVMVNQYYGLTAAHLFQQNGFDLFGHRVLTGANYNSPDQTTSVADFGVYPGWTGTISGQTIDLAWFRLSDPVDVPNLSFGTAGVGDVITYTGYGRPATPGLGLLPFDGVRRSFETTLDGFGAPGGIEEFYIEGLFIPSGLPSFRPLGGVVTGGSSGSGGFNEFGELISIAALGAGSPNYGGASYGNYLGYGDIPIWLDQVIVPAPGASVLLVLSGLAAASRRRRF